MFNDAVSLRFGPYRLHPVQGLTEGDSEIHVTPKSLAVLYILARRSGQIVTKEELFGAAWPSRMVSDAALSSCIRELRQALGDDARNPHYIETVHRRGFRFLPSCSEIAGREVVSSPDNLPVAGRELQLDELMAQLDCARSGPARLVGVLGDEGSGKNMLVDALVARAATDQSWQVGRGACDELAGSGDPYRPLLDALTALCLQPNGAQTVSQLRLHAPTWLAELTSVLQPVELAAQRLKTSGATTERIHRELGAALVAIAARRPVLLVLEDVQWSDEATLDWLAGFEQPLAAPILVLVTHNGEAQIDVTSTLALESFDGDDRLARLGDHERQVLEAGGVIGTRFSGAAIATVLDLPHDVVDDALAGLVAAGHLARDTGAGRVIDDTAAPVYRFGSRTHRSRLLEALPVQRGRRLHRRIARSVETAFAEVASDRSPELAVRYEQAYDVERAVGSYYDAAILCRRRGAHRIAHTHLRRALALLPGMNDSAERSAWDALLHTADGGELVARQGLGDAEVDGYFERALALTKEMTASQRSFAILWRIWVFYLNRGPMAKAHEIAGQLFEIARVLDDTALELSTHHAFWGTALMLGDVRGVLRHAREGIALCGAGLDDAIAITTGCTLHDAHVRNHHAAVCAGFCSAWAEALAGHPQDAKRSVDAAITLARDFGHPFTLAKALVQSAAALAAGGDTVNTRRYASEGAAVARDHGFAMFQAWSSIYEGWAAAKLGDTHEGLSTMHEGLAVFRGTALRLFRPFQLALAAEIELENGMYDAAARSLEEAFTIADRVGDRLAAAELHRLRGELAIATSTLPDHLVDAERDLRAAVDIATATGAERVRIAAARSLERFERTNGRRRGEPAGQTRAVPDLAERRRGRDA